MTDHVRQITWEVENPRQLVDRMAGQPIDAIIESVRDGSTIRAFLLPDFYHITLMMSGMRVRLFLYLFGKINLGAWFFLQFYSDSVTECAYLVAS